MCSSGICSCVSQRLQYDNATGNCVSKTLVSGSAYCNSDADCSLYTGAICDDVCKCPNGTNCTEACKLGESCNPGLTCDTAIVGWECLSSGIQGCNASRVPNGDYFCQELKELNETCSSNVECSGISGGFCIGNICICGSGYRPKDKECSLISGTNCSSDINCTALGGNTYGCFGGSCQCTTGYYQDDQVGFHYLLPLGSSCQTIQNCLMHSRNTKEVSMN